MNMNAAKQSNKRSRKSEKVMEKTADELELEEFLFGKDIINSRPAKEEEEIEIVIDTAPAQSTTTVWHDDEDDELEIDLMKTSRLKKLRKSDSADKVVTSDVFANALQERFQTRQLEWAKVEDSRLTSMVEDRGLDEEDLQLLHQSSSLVGGSRTGKIRNGSSSSTATGKTNSGGKKKTTSRAVGGSTYIDDTAAPYLPLPAGVLNIKRLVNANIAEPSNQAITAVDFHPAGDLLLVAGEDKYMRFFKIDGEKNEKQLSVRLNDMSVQNAVFRRTGAGNNNNTEVLACGRKPFFYSYDTESGNVSKIPAPAGRGLKSLEYMQASPEGSLLAFRGASGYVHICNGASKQWAMEVKLNTAVRSHCFLDERTLATSGVDADVYIWDLRKTGRCVARFPHDDGTCTSHLSAYTPYSAGSNASSNSAQSPLSANYKLAKLFLAVGAESGVVSIFGADVDPVSGAHDFMSGSGAGSAAPAGAVRQTPKQLRSLMNLTMQITSTCFHPSGQIVAIASNQKQNQLKLIHLPSCTMFTNWPTQKTPFQRVTSMAFSNGGGGYFAVGNNTGKVLLYQMPHFGSA